MIVPGCCIDVNTGPALVVAVYASKCQTGTFSPEACELTLDDETIVCLDRSGAFIGSMYWDFDQLNYIVLIPARD